ncbi:MAG TPA: SCP2 sterol-binding domain-containing protein [Acidimicrobiia bacterium]|nr:SCP2 sterol-binding domain-containing protein [Acidimicrobiia bacterium]
MTRASVSGTVEVVVARGKRPTARLVARYEAGRLRDITAADASTPLEPAAAVVLTLSPDDAAAVRDGALDLSVAFMRGQMKMAGDFGVLLAVLPITRDVEHRAALSAALTAAL